MAVLKEITRPFNRFVKFLQRKKNKHDGDLWLPAKKAIRRTSLLRPDICKSIVWITFAVRVITGGNRKWCRLSRLFPSYLVWLIPVDRRSQRAKLRSVLHYFQRLSERPPEGHVTFARQVRENETIPRRPANAHFFFFFFFWTVRIVYSWWWSKYGIDHSFVCLQERWLCVPARIRCAYITRWREREEDNKLRLCKVFIMG